MLMNDNGTEPAWEEILTAGAEDRGSRLDAFLTRQVNDLSRSRVQRLIEDSRVAINQAVCTDKNYRLRAGDRVTLTIPPPEKAIPEPEKIPLDIVYEDIDLLVINKPRGMVVHPAPGHHGGTLVNALLSCCNDLSGIGGVMRPGIVHRLDKDTSGLLIAAKNDHSHQALSDQLKNRKIKREYIALVHGEVRPFRGVITAPIARHPRHRKKMAVIEGGRESVTRYRVLKHFEQYSLLRVNLETGRTHQIRVHLSYLGHPVVGDEVYAKGDRGELPGNLISAHALHAYRLHFSHPRSGKAMNFRAKLPNDFIKALYWLKDKQL